MSINQIKQYIFVNIPICTFGCVLMIMFEKYANIKLSVIPFLDLIEKAAAKREADAKAKAAAANVAFAVISEDGEEDKAVEEMILARRDAKKAKNFAEADRIRDELKAMGIEARCFGSSLTTGEGRLGLHYRV